MKQSERSATEKDYGLACEREFVPHPLLRNAHLMTVLPGFLPRRHSGFIKTSESKLFHVGSETALLGHCHWQKRKDAPALIILHGLEGSSESSHVLGIGSKAFARGFSVIRLNMRNCGGSLNYARSLYNAGLWEDLHAVMSILHSENRVDKFFLVGYSLGGNLVLNAAAHHDLSMEFRIEAVCAVSPSIDLDRSVTAIELPENRIYQQWFLRSLKQKILAKSRQYPHVYKTDRLDSISTLREFDDLYTAPHGGYGNADRYYREASSISRIKEIKSPALIITSEDDPLIPVDSFLPFQECVPQVELLVTKYGGHCGFFQKDSEEEPLFDRFWAENRVVGYIRRIFSEVNRA